MSIFLLQELIDKKDNFEIVRDQISKLLVDEVVNQMAKAALAAKNPELWRLNVFLERSDAWSAFQDAPDPLTEKAAPIVNIWYDGGSFPGDRGDSISTQRHNATYNIDVYGYASAADDGAGGQVLSDKKAATECHRGVRLVRNILMSSSNTYLQLPNIEAKPRLVTGRRFTSFRYFQPQINEHAIQGVVGTRMSFEVGFPELSPQYEGALIEEINIDITHGEDGQVTSNLLIEFNP